MSDQTKIMQEVIETKSLDQGDAKLAKECMVELCKLCDAQKSLASLNDLFYNLSDGIILLGLDFSIIDANKLGRIFLAEYDSFKFQNKEYSFKDLPVLKELKSNQEENIIKVETSNKKNDLKVFNISCSYTYSENSEPIGICMVVNDVTQVEKQVRQLEDMMASFTHDLKTPLIALETNISHMLDGEYGECSDELKSMLELMHSSSANTLRLVKNLLTVFKYDTRSYKLLFKDIKARELINNAVRNVDPLIGDKFVRITTELESNYTVHCDSFEIERVLTNLLSNAIKFSNGENQIDISVVKEAEYFVFSVEDQGIGIPKDYLSSLFTRFWQSKVYDSSTNGTGLGLYLSRQIIEAHNGTIWAESEEGRGTKVSFKIPSIKNLVVDKKAETMVRSEYSG